MTIKTQKRSYHQVSQQPLIQTSQGMLQSLKETLVGGFGAGIGMNVADRAISSIFGPRKVEVQHTSVASGPQVESGPQVGTSCEDILSIYKNVLSKGESIPQSLEERYNKCINSTTW